MPDDASSRILSAGMPAPGAHDVLYANQNLLGVGLHEPIAQSPGIPADALDAAIFEGGSRINGIPCFFVNGRCFVPQAGF